MNQLYSIMLLLCPFMAHAVFNPMAGDQLWAIAAETGRIASAIEGTQTRIQQSDIGATGYVITAPGRYALVEDITYTAAGSAPAISIEANNVYLDLNGFTITGGGAAAHLIAIGDGITPVSNITIINGTLNNATNNALEIAQNSTNLFICQLNIANSTSNGIHAAGTAGNEIEDLWIQECQTEGVGAIGIMLEYTTCARLEQIFLCDNTLRGIATVNARSIVVRECDAIRSGIGFSFQDSRDIAILQCVSSENTLGGIGAGISILNGSRFTIQDFQSLDDLIGISFGNTIPNVHASNISILGSSGSGIFGRVANACFENVCIEEGFRGIFFDTNSYNISLKNISVSNISPNSGIEFAATCSHISIENAAVTKASAHGFVFGEPCLEVNLESCIARDCGGSGFLSNDLGSASIRNCKAIENGVFGFSFISTNSPTTDLRNTGIILDACEAISNLNTGFDIGTGMGLTTTPVLPISDAVISNCVAIQNGGEPFGPFIGHNFDLGLIRSIVYNNKAINAGIDNIRLKDSAFGQTGLCQIIENNCSNPGLVNFREYATLTFPNAYLGNAASALLLTNNYQTGGSSPITGNVTASLNTPPPNFTRWTNISNTLT